MFLCDKTFFSRTNRRQCYFLAKNGPGDKVFKSRPKKLWKITCEKFEVINVNRTYLFKIFKGYLPYILYGPYHISFDL